MLIVVQYTDETYDMVIDYHLDELINEGKIAGFSSSNGWVRVPAKGEANNYASSVSAEECYSD